LSDAPRFLLTDAQHWESGRVIETWSYRWASEIFHEFGKQVTGLEAAQVRKEEAVTRHFRSLALGLSCLTLCRTKTLVENLLPSSLWQRHSRAQRHAAAIPARATALTATFSSLGARRSWRSRDSERLLIMYPMILQGAQEQRPNHVPWAFIYQRLLEPQLRW
jgi:hypothetical protein